MRIAAVMLMLCLVTTCAISGTFAKYTTEGKASDTARVAKWGVAIQTSSDIFDESYNATDTSTAGSIAQTVKVDTEGTTNLVAPGTNKSVNFGIKGTPEVAVKVTFAMTVTSDVVIPAGTTVKEGETALADPYTPVVFTLKKGDAVLATGTLAAIETALEAQTLVTGPNVATDATYTLSWDWAFNGTNDAADTYLGNVAAGATGATGTSTAINFEIIITATQVD
jgi:hypothetical protein